ncbi:MAG: hypothetical protein ACPG8W_03070 [Candidatus Promineifilaceae bacterium]
MITLQKNWKLWLSATLTTIALTTLPLVELAYACGAGGSQGGC